MAAGQHTDRLAGGDHVAGPDGGADRFVGGPQPARVADADDAAPGHDTGERDDATARRPHDGSGRGGKINPAVPGEPGSRRRIEAPYHVGRVHGPDVRLTARAGNEQQQ
jgi:hypothetical protein